jgi:predicted DNA repair protein MutK
MAYDIAALLKVIGASLDDAALAAKRMTAASLDDVGASAKTAAVKSAGVVVDDAAAMPQYANGLHAARELPVVARIALGSLINKIVLIPVALLLSVYAPWAIPPLLVAGGLFLCLEGVEGVHEKLAPHAEEACDDAPPLPPEAAERKKVWEAIRTDGVLSAEIIVISLGTMLAAPLTQKALALALVGLSMTALVYGAVALIIKMDDIGLVLLERGIRRGNAGLRQLGNGLVAAMPRVLVALSYLGTVAMLAVGGGILAHHLPFVEHLAAQAGGLAGVVELLLATLVGGVAGTVAAVLLHVFARLRGAPRAAH